MNLTPEQFDKLATKDEFNNLSKKVDNLEGRFDNLEGRFDNLEGKFDKLLLMVLDNKEKIENCANKDDVRQILGAIDAIVKKHTDFDEEMTMNQSAHDRFEKRIGKLEQAPV